MKKILSVILCGFLAASLPQGIAFAKRNLFGKKAKAAAAVKDTVPEPTDYDKFMKDKPETHKGFITVHKLKGKVYFEYPLALLGREMLLGSTISETSDNGDGIIGSKPDEPLHITFAKVGEKMCMMRVLKDYTTDSQRPELIEAINKNTAGSIVSTFKIKAYNADSTAVLFDVTPFFVSDRKDMRPFDTFSQNTAMGMINRSPSYESDKSFLGEVKSFETNLSVRSHLSYTYSLTYRDRTIAEDVPFTAVVTRSIILLDEKPYRSRPTDSRIAIFPTGKYLYSEKAQRSKIVYFANRWRLEPKDTVAFLRGELTDPVKPIVFYIDPAFPQAWQGAIYEAVNQWKEPFEKIGFSNAIMAKPFPTDDPEFDPDNMKYSCIRYAPTQIENAMGPSWVDPRSGEILTASVYVYHDVVKIVNQWRYIQTAQADARVRSGNLPDDILNEGLSYVIGHEVGHCLGLMHNMSASATIPVDSLRSPTFTRKYGTTHSIMDYARNNYVAQPGDLERGVKLTPPKFGLYDYFTIRYSYTPLIGKTPEEEKEILGGWLREAQADPIYRYGKQQGATIDPRSQNEDLGDNSVKASEYGVKNLKYILANINNWVENDPDYSYRKELYTGIVYQYLTYVQHVYANIGGMYFYEKNADDPVDYAYSLVPYERQKEAFDFLCAQVRDTDWLDNPELMKNIQIMGSPANALRNAIVSAIVACPAKILQYEQMGHDEKAYKSSDCMKDVYDFVWKPSLSGKKLSEVDKSLQREYLRYIFSSAGFQYEGRGAGQALTSAASSGLQTPEFLSGCRHIGCSHAAGGEVLGYGSPYAMFLSQLLPEAEAYEYAMKAKKTLERAVRSASGSDKAHYELLLRNIEKTLK